MNNILDEKEISEKHEIMMENLKDMEKELAVWHGWLVLNEGAFAPQDIVTALRHARAIVSELLLIDVEQ